MNKFLISENTCGPLLCMYMCVLCLAEDFHNNCKTLPSEEAAQWKFYRWLYNKLIQICLRHIFGIAAIIFIESQFYNFKYIETKNN